MSIENHLYIPQTTTPQGLLIILPGRGYLLEHPLLYYLAKMGSELGYDVLGIRYSFQLTVTSDLPPVDYDALRAEVEAAADEVSAQRQYERVYIAGKSIGTPLAVELGARFENVDLRYILLTPIVNVTELVDERPTLAVIGTEDGAYNAELVAADRKKPYMQWYVLDGLGHSLEFEYGWDKTIEVLGRVIGQCEAFLRQK